MCFDLCKISSQLGKVAQISTQIYECYNVNKFLYKSSALLKYYCFYTMKISSQKWENLLTQNKIIKKEIMQKKNWIIVFTLKQFIDQHNTIKLWLLLYHCYGINYIILQYVWPEYFLIQTLDHYVPWYETCDLWTNSVSVGNIRWI